MVMRGSPHDRATFGAYSVFILALVVAAPLGAQTTGGMSAMGYYVGTWKCVAGPIGKPQNNATATYVMSGSVLNESLSVPMQNGMKGPYSANLATSYDGKGRYIQTFLDNYGTWSVSYAPPWTGNTEQWTDLTNNVGEPGHTQAVRADNDHFTFTSYGTPTGSTPNFQGSCQRQPS
jgi:hypothetical protein